MFISPHGLRYHILPISFPSHPKNAISSANDIPYILTILIIRLTSTQWLARPPRGSIPASRTSQKRMCFVRMQDDPKKGGKIRKMYRSFQWSGIDMTTDGRMESFAYVLKVIEG
jgi:hypothetical protein